IAHGWKPEQTNTRTADEGRGVPPRFCADAVVRALLEFFHCRGRGERGKGHALDLVRLGKDRSGGLPDPEGVVITSGPDRSAMRAEDHRLMALGDPGRSVSQGIDSVLAVMDLRPRRCAAPQGTAGRLARRWRAASSSSFTLPPGAFCASASRA